MEYKPSSDKRFALLIDADNVSAKYIKPILAELSKYGTVTIKRIYGDWTLTLHAKWKDALLENSLTPIQQFGYTYGKNATDSAMIIDAMDILYTDSVDGFCIVSSDSDFTRLASRLRESGRTVIGMGEKKTPTPFRRACDIFTTLELLLDNRKGDRGGNGNGAPALSKAEVEQAVVDIITDNQNNGKSTGLGEVGSRIQKRYPDFDVRNYGTNLLSKLLDEFTRVTITKDRSSVTVELTDGHHEADEAPAEEPREERPARRGGRRRPALPEAAPEEGSPEAAAEEAVVEAEAEAAPAEEAEGDAAAEQAEDAPRKATRRGRRGGRGRRSAGAEATDAHETEGDAEQPAAQTAPEEAPAAEETAEAPAQDAPAPGRRPRRRKAQPEEAAPAQAEAADEAPTQPEQADQPAETPAQPARRPRRRKAQAADGAPDEAPAAEAAPDEAPEQAPAKTRRRRSTAKKAAEAPAQPEQAEEAPAKPARRGGRKPATAKDAPVQDAKAAPSKGAKAGAAKAPAAKPKATRRKAAAPAEVASPEAYIAQLVSEAGAEGIGGTALSDAVRARFKDFKVRDLGFPQLRAYLEGQPGYVVEKAGRSFTVRAR